MNFKVGDTVQCVKPYYDDGSDGWKGLTGIVVAISSYGYPGVDFKQQSRTGCGHYLGRRIKTKTGWWFTGDDEEHYLKKIEKPKQFEFSF